MTQIIKKKCSTINKTWSRWKLKLKLWRDAARRKKVYYARPDRFTTAKKLPQLLQQLPQDRRGVRGVKVTRNRTRGARPRWWWSRRRREEEEEPAEDAAVCAAPATLKELLALRYTRNALGVVLDQLDQNGPQRAAGTTRRTRKTRKAHTRDVMMMHSMRTPSARTYASRYHINTMRAVVSTMTNNPTQHTKKTSYTSSDNSS